MNTRGRTTTVVGIVVALLAIAVIFTVVFPLIRPVGLDYAIRIFIIVAAGFLPLILYLSFARGRLQTVFSDYRQNLRRLGFPEGAPLYKDKFVEVYGRLPQAGATPAPKPEGQTASTPAREGASAPDAAAGEETEDFVARRYSPLAELPIVIATIQSILGWMVVFYPGGKESLGGLSALSEPLIYGFLGAYVFGIASLVSQFVADDIQPRYYASLVTRYLTVMALAWLIVLAAPEDTSRPALLVMTFVAGVFPMAVLRVILRKGFGLISGIAAALGKDEEEGGWTEKIGLTRLDGVKVFEEDRLAIEGINFIQGMATANVVDLMLRTRYPVERLVDWVDQALLVLYARERLDLFYASGIRSASSLLEMYPPDDPSGRSLVTRLPQEEVADRRSKLAVILQANQPQAVGEAGPASLTIEQMTALLETTAVGLLHAPNMYHVLYWRQHEFEALPEDIERERLRADLFMMQDMPARAAELYTQVLQNYPDSRNTLLYRGLAFAQQRKFPEAIADYRQAIGQRSAWENLHIAYLSLGRAYEQMEDYPQARDAYLESVRIDPTFHEARRTLAYLQMTRLGAYEDSIGNWTAMIEDNYLPADSYANRGLARYTLWQQHKDQASLLDEAETDLRQAIRLDRGLIPAYLNLALVQMEKTRRDDAIETYSHAILQIASQQAALQAGEFVAGDQPADPAQLTRNAYLARLRRGNLYKDKGEFNLALEDYQAAARLLPSDAGALYNMALMLYKLGQNTQAMLALREAIRLVPGHAPAHQLLGDLLTIDHQREEAEKEYGTALRLAREQRDRQGEALANFSLGKLYRLLGSNSDARRELNQARMMADQAEDNTLYTQVIFELGLLEFTEKQYPEALGLFNQAATLFDVLKLGREAMRVNIKLAETYLALKNKPEALVAITLAERELNRTFDPSSTEDQSLETQINNIKTEAAPKKRVRPAG
jgi:tetratricopeptide (TPR) repeat protein